MKVLMVSGEYPPMKGGVGRYTSKLVSALKKHADVAVVCAERSDGEMQVSDNVYHVLRKGDYNNSDKVLQLINELRPDIVHIQYEPGLYESGRLLDHFTRMCGHESNLHELYDKSKVPLVTTPHTVFPYEEFHEHIMEMVHRKEYRSAFLPFWFHSRTSRYVTKKLHRSLNSVIELSDQLIHLAKVSHDLSGRGTVIYHGAEPAFGTKIDKGELRKELGLPTDSMLLLSFGFAGYRKGFNILEKIELPREWMLVTNHSKHERGVEHPIHLSNAINLNLGYLDEQNFSKLFFACDAAIIPYRIVSVSGVLFDALAHGLPFVASNLALFREFADLGLGVVSQRNPKDLSIALEMLASDYQRFKTKVDEFKTQLKWDLVASKHIELYSHLFNGERNKCMEMELEE